MPQMRCTEHLKILYALNSAKLTINSTAFIKDER